MPQRFLDARRSRTISANSSTATWDTKPRVAKFKLKSSTTEDRSALVHSKRQSCSLLETSVLVRNANVDFQIDRNDECFKLLKGTKQLRTKATFVGAKIRLGWVVRNFTQGMYT